MASSRYPCNIGDLAPIMVTGIGIASALAGYWATVAGRAWSELRRTPRIRQGLSLPTPVGGWPRVSIIVPAHNEESHAPRCAQSLLAQVYPGLEVIFVLDRCTDGTLAALSKIAATDARLVIVENHDCPSDWAGKCNAAAVGARHATGEMLLFTDADTLFDPELVRAAVALTRQRGVALMSILSTLTTEHWFERVAQPAAVLALMQQYPTGRANDPVKPRAFANGQFMLFERSAYEELGGHAAVKDDLLEDIAFARAVTGRPGRKTGLCLAEGMLVVSMYESLGAFEEGWKRIFIESCTRRPSRMRRKAVEQCIVGVLLPAANVVGVALAFTATRISPASALAYWALGAGLTAMLIQVFVLKYLYGKASSPARGLPLHWLGCLVVSRILWRGASDLRARRPVRWGGREYILEPR